jgi:hypothetical protein
MQLLLDRRSLTDCPETRCRKSRSHLGRIVGHSSITGLGKSSPSLAQNSIGGTFVAPGPYLDDGRTFSSCGTANSGITHGRQEDL